jgi:hypothetical protein
MWRSISSASFSPPEPRILIVGCRDDDPGRALIQSEKMGDGGSWQDARPGHGAPGCLKARRQPSGEVCGRGSRIPGKQDRRLGTLERKVLGKSNTETADGILVKRRLIGAPSNTVSSKKGFQVLTSSKAVSDEQSALSF